MRVYLSVIIIIIISFTFSCKSKSTPLKTEPIEEIDDSVFEDKDMSDTTNVILKTIDSENKIISGVAIKFVIDDNICRNAYSDFDGWASILFDKSKVGNNSYFEIVYKEYSKKIISFDELSKNNIIVLEKKKDLVTFKEYRKFYEEIRRCGR